MVGFVTAVVAPVLILARLVFSGVAALVSNGSLDLSNANSYDISETVTVSTSDTIMHTNDGSSSKVSENTAITISAYYYDATFDSEDITLAQLNMNGNTYYIDANDISLKQDNTINAYIAETLGYSRTDIADDIENSFEQAAYRTDDRKPLGVIIHDIGVGNSTIEGEASYTVQNYDEEGVFVHSSIDSSTVLRIADEGYKAQGAGANANPHYIQLELAYEDSRKDFVEQLVNATYHTAYMLGKYDLPITLGQEDGEGTIWTHKMVSPYLGGTGHVDPTDYQTETANDYFDMDYDIEGFVELIQAYYNAL